MNFDETFKVNDPDLTIKIKRISPGEGLYKSFKLLPIENSAFFHFGNKITKDPLILPKLYAALTYFTGYSDDFYDEYKGSFSFTFELNVNKNGNSSKYYYNIYHYRSYIEFGIYLLVPKSDSRDERHYVRPDDNLFSDKEIYSFSTFFCLDSIRRIEDLNYIPKPFVKYSNSNLLLFGHEQDKYFYEAFDDQEKYEERKLLLEEKINNIPELENSEPRTIADSCREEDIARGVENKAIEVAKKMLAKGMLLDEIIELTDLTPEQIEKLKSS